MNDKQRLIILLCAVALIGVLTLVIVTTPLAQDEYMDEEMMMMEQEGMMPGVGIAGRGGVLTWEEHPMPEELTMPYSEWLAQEGRSRAPIPEWYVLQEDGTPKKYTPAQWYQLHTIYEGVEAAARERPTEGAVGGKLLDEVQTQLVVQRQESELPRPIYEAGLGDFYFQVTYPTYNIGEVTQDAVTISLDVIMRVKESLSRSYGEFVRKKLAPYSNPGPNRADFYVVTYQRSYWRPYHFKLLPSTIAELNRLWGGNTINLELLDRADEVIASSAQSAGHSAETINHIAYPPEIDLNPSHQYRTGAQLIDFAGNKLQLHNIHGWRYSFRFTISLQQLARLHKVRVQFLDTEQEVRSENVFVGTGKAPFAGLLGGAGGAPGGPGAPGEGFEEEEMMGPGGAPLPGVPLPPGQQVAPAPPPMPGMI